MEKGVCSGCKRTMLINEDSGLCVSCENTRLRQMVFVLATLNNRNQEDLAGYRRQAVSLQYKRERVNV